jgi:hypothetical protein
LNLRKAQQGAALLALAALLVLATSWMLVSAFASVAGSNAAQVARNARVLAEAKAALIAWVARTALEPAESNPGRLPCPQAWGDLGSANEGRAAAVCAATAAGWLPWRSLGLPVMLDASGQQLWYVISPGWHLPNGGASLTVNSNTPGRLLLDGRAVIALLIAPGPALNIAPDAAQRAAGCNVRRQSRARNPQINPNPRDFLDCQNGSTADNVFVSAVAGNAAHPVFNDQVLAITAADLLPALEAAIAKRIERDIVPPLKNVYASAVWGASAANPLFPFAAPFTNPGTSAFQGAAGVFQGLLPFNQIGDCAGGPRCLPALVGWAATPPNAYLAGAYGQLRSQSCAWEVPGEIRVCEGEYQEDGAQPWRAMRIEMMATFTNVAMGLRVIDATRMEVLARNSAGAGTWQARPVTYSATIQPNGSATLTFGATLPNIDDMGWGSYARFRVRIERAAIADHPLLGASAPGTGWFVRNEWYRLLYYATCDRVTPTCLQVANFGPANRQRAILILAGRSLGGAARPNGNLEDFLDSAANRDGDNAFEQLAVNRTFNDRVVVLDANP